MFKIANCMFKIANFVHFCCQFTANQAEVQKGTTHLIFTTSLACYIILYYITYISNMVFLAYDHFISPHQISIFLTKNDILNE